MASVKNKIKAAREARAQKKARLAALHRDYRARKQADRLRHQQHWAHIRALQKRAKRASVAVSKAV